MGRAHEVISFSATAPGAGATMLAVAGDSLTIRDGAGAVLLATVGKRQEAGFQAIASPLLHDSTVGITNMIRSGTPVAMFCTPQQTLRAQDQLDIGGSGSAVAGDIELGALIVSYDNLPGVDGRFIDNVELMRRAVNQFDMLVNVVATGAGGYTGSTPINSFSDYFKANTDYALLGIANAVSNDIALVRLTGPDWGNLGVGVPNITDNYIAMSSWFSVLTQASGVPSIPVMNSSNRSTTLISALADENGVAQLIALRWVELSQKRSGR